MMLRLFVVVLSFMLTVCSTSAIAATISLLPKSTTASVGDILDFDLLATLDTGEIIDWYDMDVKFDDTILNYTAYTIGNGLGENYNNYSIDPENDRLPYGTATLTMGSNSELSNQVESVVLATLTFKAQAAGHAILDFGYSEIKYDDYQYKSILGDLSLTSAEVNVTNAVPVPPTAWLLGSCLIGLCGIRRKFR